GLLLPFEAVNLRAVDIKVYKIYENNLMQFFQNNDLTGNSELARVGRRIFKKTIMLNTATNAPTDYSNWNRFSIDLSKFIITEPGALYRVTIDFKKEHSVYPCSGDNTSDELISDWEEDDDNFDIDEWNYYSDYYEDDYYYYDYDWQERDNPCDQSYYRRKGVSRNVLASDIGLITKIGNDGSIRIFATDLKTAKPLNAITIELYNFQQQLIEKLMTNTDGIATTTLKNKPFLLIAKNRSQRGYLKLNAGSSLSLSKFDVTGVSVQKGIKGFIYGERGVWRPGDTLFLTFILEDKTKKLPESMPVIFDLYNPKGQVYKHIVNSKSVNGFYTFQVVTDPDAPTGNWRANIKVGGASFTKYLRIETIKPNRLKIKLEFEGDCIKKSENKNGSLEVSWLHGAIAKNLKADVKLTLSATRTKFKNFDDYNFDDPSQPFNSETYTVFDSKVDADGKASINPNINIENSAPGILTAFFKTRVFEESGNFSVNGLSVPFYPYESYVGISTPEGKGWSNMLVTDKTHYIQIANVDVDGKILKNNDVTIDVYKIGWNWWYDRTGNRLANYINSSYNTPMISKELQILNGKAKFPLLIKQPDWGRFFIRITDNTSGHSTGQIIYIDWPYWENRNRGGEEDASLLSFTADKEKYTVGEEVKLNIPSGEDGRALVSIENGTKVIETFWVNTMKEFTEFSFKVTEEMSPNIYVNVTLIQQHAQTKNDLPIRLYGIIPLTVEDPNTHVYPIIETAKVFKPETNTTIKIKEKTGKAMTYTIAVVDDGLLDLTNFKTPDPWNHFYAREALGVKTWDLFDYVMGAFGGQLDRILAIGGDEGGGGDGKGKNRANRFKPMVKFFGPFKLKAGETKAQTFMMPQYVG
ncbi:MAG: hypothetical protein H8E61_00390, partial [Bacteroidetes bacterium]|nr:hypothetical protein [Bacteroidota bacterium]